MARLHFVAWLAALMAWNGGLPDAAEACTVCILGDNTPTSLGAGIPSAGRVRLGAQGQLRSARYGQTGVDRLDVSEQWLLLRGAWSFSDRGMVTLQLPLLRRSISFPNLSKDIAYGPGDMELGGRIVVFRDRRFEPHHVLAVRAAVELPTGLRRSGPSGDTLPIDQQLGSGGLDGRVGVDYAWLEYPAAVFVSFTGQVSSPGFLGTVPGPVVLGAVTGQVSLVKAFALRLGGQVRWEGPLRFREGNLDPDSGGVMGIASPALIWRPDEGWFLALGVDWPVLQSLRGEQFVGPTSYLEVVVDV